jgi:predicted metal-dependent hydrolase
MSQLKVRKIDFQFDDDIALQWNPQNPYCGNFVNYASLIGPAFERYFIRATRDAIPDIHNASVKKDAELFCQQEAQHSRHHLAHLNMLIKKYPGLDETRQKILASYEHLLATQNRDFHLAYAACIELMFGPLARFVVNNREPLFAGSDTRIASFMLWHLVEEFEHRNSAYDVYNELVGSYWFRLKTVPKVIKHMNDVYQIAIQGFEQHVPKNEWDAVGPIDTSGLCKNISVLSQLGLLYELACTLLPYHKPNNMQQPQWVTQWFADENAGVNMARYYP